MGAGWSVPWRCTACADVQCTAEPAPGLFTAASSPDIVPPTCLSSVFLVLYFLSFYFYYGAISVSLSVKPFNLDLGTVFDCMQWRICGSLGSCVLVRLL